MKTRHVSKDIDVFQRTCPCLLELVFQRTCSCLLDLLDLNLFTFLQDRVALLLNLQHVGYVYYFIIYFFPSLCPHTVF